jgi:hypothetical protein
VISEDGMTLLLIRRILNCIEHEGAIVTVCSECRCPWFICDHGFDTREELYGRRGLHEYVHYFEYGG